MISEINVTLQTIATHLEQISCNCALLESQLKWRYHFLKTPKLKMKTKNIMKIMVKHIYIQNTKPLIHDKSDERQQNHKSMIMLSVVRLNTAPQG